MNPQALIAQVAREYVGTRETSRNRGPHLEDFWKATGYPDGAEDRQPWCSAFVAFCVQEADRRSPVLDFPKPPAFAAVAQWKPWAEKPENGCLVISASDVAREHFQPQAGDIVTFLPRLSHIGIVGETYDWHGVIRTIEGNTNHGGSREGDGVYARERMLSFCGTFIRLPARGVRA